MLKTAALLTGAVLLGVLYFLVTLAENATLVILAGIVLGIASFFFWKLLDLEAEGSGPGNVILTAGLAACLGASLRTILGLPGSGLWDWIGVVVASSAAWSIYAIKGWGQTTLCFLCKLPVAESSSVSCPRCQQIVCVRPSCWDARHFRCTYCHERGVILFPTQENWWVSRLGRRATQGQCDSCYKEAHEADLQECGQCHWPLCKRCWDYHNGQCTRCKWVIPDLPRQLRPFIRSSATSVRRGQRAVSSR